MIKQCFIMLAVFFVACPNGGLLQLQENELTDACKLLEGMFQPTRFVKRGRDLDHPDICKCSIAWNCEEGGDRRHTMLNTLFDWFFFNLLDANGDGVLNFSKFASGRSIIAKNITDC